MKAVDNGIKETKPQGFVSSFFGKRGMAGI
jgi:hypothetical protein